MQNKKVLVLLGMVLFLAVVLIVFYVYQSKIVPTETPVLQKTQSVNKKVSLEKEKINKIKEEMKYVAVNNKTFEQIKEDSSEEEKEYTEKITTEGIRIAEGEVTKKQNSSLEVKFDQETFIWTSTVNIDKNTTIFNNITQNQLSISDLKVGDSVIVRTMSGSVTDAEFSASKIFKQ